MSGTQTLRLPRVYSYWWFYAGDVPGPADMIGWQLEFYRPFPYPELQEAIAREEVWHPNRPDCPADLCNKTTGEQWSGRTDASNRLALVIRLNGQYTVRDNLAHETGHCAQHFYDVLPTSDWSGQAIRRCWRDAGGTEEDFANAFGAYVLGLVPQSPYFRWFPIVLAYWRAHAPHIDNTVRVDNIWQWFNASTQRMERFTDGGWTYSNGSTTWAVFTPN